MAMPVIEPEENGTPEWSIWHVFLYALELCALRSYSHQRADGYALEQARKRCNPTIAHPRCTLELSWWCIKSKKTRCLRFCGSSKTFS